jgi:glutamate/tyrosine decarboxylase-like PLP-dependent enzyme
MNSARDLEDALLAESVRRLFERFESLPEGVGGVEYEAVRRVLLEAAERLGDNYPYHHPLYVGQMLKPPHPVARLAYALAMHLNPNNHALDGGRASSAMEKEAVAQIATMFGWQDRHLGHLTGGGTMANFEALWVARELAPGKAIAASSQAHYTHSRLSAVLGIPFREIAVDPRGRMDPEALRRSLSGGEIGTVVATLGTTAAGAVDPLPEILALRDELGFRLHVDTAYGGYFRLVDHLEDETAEAFGRIDEVDSIVVDPHKHGLQPYGCGCVLFREPAVGRFYRHDSPYTYFSSADLSLGEISLECSRAGASAVALWATLRLLPLERGGAFAASLARGRMAAIELHRALDADPRFGPLFPPQLDIVVWTVRAPSASRSSSLARRIFDAAAESDLHLALAEFPRELCERAAAVEEWDTESVTCLRACAMKPEHRDWMPEILERLDGAARRVLGEVS